MSQQYDVKEQGKEDGEAMLEDLARTAARQNSMTSFKVLSHGSKLYRVAPGWEGSMIKNDINVRCVKDLRAFEGAVRDPDLVTIYIPIDVAVSEQKIEQICHRYGITKTIYKEVAE